MNNKNLVERRFISRLEHTRAVFDYISLDTIVNGQLKQKILLINVAVDLQPYF
jgi:hypothetical protein